jgi:hypothetical protein
VDRAGEQPRQWNQEKITAHASTTAVGLVRKSSELYLRGDGESIDTEITTSHFGYIFIRRTSFMSSTIRTNDVRRLGR